MSEARSSKIGYLSGPVDARVVYDAWESGASTDLFGTSYLRHWYAELRRQGRQGVVVTSHEGEAYSEQRGEFTILNRPVTHAGGAQYHWDMMRWHHECLREMEKLGCQVVVLTQAVLFRAATYPFRRRGMRFIDALHGGLRAMSHSSLSIHELLLRLGDTMHWRYADPALVASPKIARELEAMSGASRRETLLFLPDYNREDFASFEPAKIDGEPIRILSAGRIVENKGVFDLLETLKLLEQKGGKRFELHFCGDGEDLPRLRAAAEPFGDRVVFHGFVKGRGLLEHFEKADIVVVPTRSECEEGFAMIVLEGVLALRPVVTSRACPALELLADACVEAKVDDPSSYADAIWRLATEPELVEQKMTAAKSLQEHYFDPPERYDRQLRKALALVDADGGKINGKRSIHHE